MEGFPRGEDRGHGHGGGTRHRHIPHHRHGAQAIGAKRRDQAGGGNLVLRIGFAQSKGQLRGQQRGQAKAQQQRAATLAKVTGQNRHDPAQKPGQREGPHAGGAAASGFLAFAPMALGADKQANGERGSQAAYQFFRVHRRIRRQAQPYRKRKACAGAPIAAIWRGCRYLSPARNCSAIHAISCSAKWAQSAKPSCARRGC